MFKTYEWADVQDAMACEIAVSAIVGHLLGEPRQQKPKGSSARSVSALMSLCNSRSELAVFTDNGASFVTLEKQRQLRGCIGTLEACQPLGLDIAHNAVAAGFSDPRFPALTVDELANLDMSISVLSASSIIECQSEAGLIAALRPGDDGLILEYGQYRSTYLPSVWEQLHEPANFVRQLKLKAGLPEDFWHKDIRCSRYSVHYVRCGCAFDKFTLPQER